MAIFLVGKSGKEVFRLLNRQGLSLNIKLLPGIQHGFKIIQSALGMEVLNSGVFSVMHTDEELSIVCESSIKLFRTGRNGLVGTESG